MTTTSDVKSNGHGTYDPKGFAAGSTLRPKGSSGDAKELITTNDKKRDVLMKCHVLNPDHAKKAAMALYWCRDHIDKDGSDEEELVWDTLALYCAIGGKRAQMLLEGITGILLGHKNDGASNLDRFKKEAGNT
jgi:hypothetical protein